MRRLPPKNDRKPTQSEGTNDPLIADHRNFYKVEKWTKDGSKVDQCLCGASGEGAVRDFAAAIKHRPRIRLTIAADVVLSSGRT